ALVLLWAMLWDRARGRRRCPRCFYDMSGAPTAPDAFPLVCPECGRRIANSRGLGRARRRWRIAVAAGLIGAASLIAPLMLTGSWLRFVPAPALDRVIGTFFEQQAVAAYAAVARRPIAPDSATLGAEWKRYLACWEAGRVTVEMAESGH